MVVGHKVYALPLMPAMRQQMNLTQAQRESVGIRHILPCDMTDAELAKHNKQKKNARKRAKRRAAGANPREKSKSRLKPWEALGMGESRFYELGYHRTNSGLLLKSDGLTDRLSTSPNSL